MADLGGLAFFNGQGHIDAVAVQRAGGRGDRHGVLAAVVVLALQFLGHAVQAETVKGAAFGQADVLQAGHQLLGLDVLVAGDGQLVDRGPLTHGDHQDVALAIEPDVFEKAGAVQGAHGVGDLGVINAVATLHREVGENGTGSNALQAVDADVARGEGLGGQSQCRGAQASGEGEG